MKKLILLGCIIISISLTAHAKKCDLSIIFPVDQDRIPLYDQKYIQKIHHHFSDKGYIFNGYIDFYFEKVSTAYTAEFQIWGMEGFNASGVLVLTNNLTGEKIHLEKMRYGQKSEKIYAKLTKKIPACSKL